MAIGAGSVWRVRVGGSNLNSSAFDSTTPSAGTDLTQADAATLSLTDLTSTASTTITSATGGFTSAMIGNALRLYFGTGATLGYYFIQTRVDTNTITVDRVSGTYTNGKGRVGGAALTLAQVFSTASGSGGHAVPGNIIYIRGAGSDTPTANDYTTSGSYTPSPGTDLLPIKIIGENGRPRLTSDGAMFGSGITFTMMENLYLTASAATNGDLGIVIMGEGSTIRNCIIDANNQDSLTGIRFDLDGSFVDDCHIFGTTSTPVASTATDCAGIALFALTGGITNCTINNFRGHGILAFAGTIHNNIVYNNAVDGVQIYGFTGSYLVNIEANTIDSNAGHGVYFDDDNFMYQTVLRNNIISNQAGASKYGIKVATGTGAQNDFHKRHIDYNVLFGNTANYSGISAGAHDTQGTDPGYTSASTLDFSTGIAMSGLAWPGAIRGSGTTSYPRPGVYQAAAADTTRLDRILRKVLALEKRLHLHELRVAKQ